MAVVLAVSASGTDLSAAPPPVYLEIATEVGLSLDAPSRWLRALQDLPLASLRIRRARGGDRPLVETRGRGADVSYRVVGIVRTDNQLYLPGGRFRLQEQARLRQWLSDLGTGQDPREERPTNAFGLSERDLVALVNRLAAPVRKPTKDQPIAQVVRQIGDDLSMRLEMDRAATTALRTGATVPDELLGMSGGTALAVALRPLDLSLIPQIDQGQVRLKISRAANLPQAWPVGWPPEQPPRATLPRLFEFLPVEIAQTPLDQALAALQGRLEVPFLLDHAALKRRQIDLSQIPVDFPAKRSFYQRILDRLLYQAGLEAELRVDEAQQPFLWISSIRPLSRG